MKQKNALVSVGITAGFLAIAVLVGIFFLSRQFKAMEIPYEPEEIVRVGGSTTVFPIARSAAKLYMSEHSSAIITVSESSSGDGLAGLIAGNLDIANLTRQPKDSEKALIQAQGKTLQLSLIARDAVVLVTHPSKKDFIKGLTREQVKGIFFDGTITDWSQLHQNLSGPIQVYVRDPFNSGTATVFAEHVAGSDKVPYVAHRKDVHLTPLIVPTVAADPAAIAYAPLVWVNASVSTLAYGETSESAVAPDLASIRSGAYPLSRPMFMATLSGSKKLAEDFIEYMRGPAGQALVKKEGFLEA